MHSGGRLWGLMNKVARLGDIAIGVCYAHETPIMVTGIIASGSPTVETNRRRTARIGDIVLFNCGHVGIIVSGSPIVLTNNQRVARIGDIVIGTMNAFIVAGSENVLVI